MRGLAQTLFFEKEQRQLGKSPASRVKKQSWPLLEQLVQQKQLSYIDFAVAERFLQSSPQASQEAAAFLCHLSLATRAGHLCVIINDQEIQPHPQELWFENAERDQLTPPQEEVALLEKMIRSGAHQLPATILSIVTPADEKIPLKPICRLDHYFYLQRNWVYESQFIHHWKKIDSSPPALTLDQIVVEQQISERLHSSQLLPEQAQAIRLAAQNSLTLITGGPGTGKTYTAGQLIKILWNAMDSQQRQECEIALAAPTGKAAANLQGSFMKAVGDLPLSQITAKTLHALLGIRNQTPAMLTADIILIDESSMIDVKMMAQLFAAVKPGVRLILMGDKHQLPPVETGGLFVDLIAHHDKIVELSICMRAELREIVDFSQAINHGNSESVLNALEKGTAVKRLKFEIPEDNVKQIHQKLLKHVEERFSLDRELIHHPDRLLRAFNQFRILSPLRQGPYGVEELNRLLLSHALKRSTGSRFIAPIMVVRNDYRLGLFNGDVGVLICHPKSLEGHFQVGDFAIFPSNSEQEPRKFSALLLPKFDYAYCLSVHKSQGSEFNQVLVLNPEGSEVFGREVLYTAVTRARRSLEVWGSDAVLKETLRRQSVRLSAIGHRLDKSHEVL